MKKLLAFSVAVATIVWSLGLAIAAPSASAAYSPVSGDLIKTASDSAVYYIGGDNQRHLYVNGVTFWTWYTGSWSSIKSGSTTVTIKIISQTDFNNVAVGDNVTVQPVTKLIKFQNSPRVYSVTAEANLTLIPDIGAEWNSKIITIQNGFENDYIKIDGLGKIYKDQIKGYQIILPSDWADYKVTNGNFLLPTSNETWYEEDAGGNKSYGYGSVFTIKSYSITEWNKMKKDCGTQGGSTWNPSCHTDSDILGKNSLSVFVLVWPNSGSDVLGGDSQWNELKNEVLGGYLKNNFLVVN